MKLAKAIEAAEERKLAVLGDHNGREPALNLTTEEQSRALISGFDIDYEELIATAQRVAPFFAAMTLEMNSRLTHQAAWSEGFIIGLFVSIVRDE